MATPYAETLTAAILIVETQTVVILTVVILTAATPTAVIPIAATLIVETQTAAIPTAVTLTAILSAVILIAPVDRCGAADRYEVVAQNVMVLNGVRVGTQSVVGDRSEEADRYVEVDRSVVSPCGVLVETPYAAFQRVARVRSEEFLCAGQGQETLCEVPVAFLV